jgi:hypothetical protein
MGARWARRRGRPPAGGRAGAPARPSPRARPRALTSTCRSFP